LYHHENLDGTGYPFGIKGDDIPKEALIIKVCDVYEALTGYRPYRNPFKPYAAAKFMIEEFVKNKKCIPLDLMEKFIAFVGAAKL
jgi:HD-GYP domain-containing protein (c-di-GMP phosphodiesterase class II)